MSHPVVLTIAGSDSGGGAGIQADIKTFKTLGVHGVSVVTAATAQNTQRVLAANLLDPQVVESQLEAIAEDFDISAVKLGMLGNAAICNVVADFLAEVKPSNLVIDTVLASTTGAVLLEEAGVEVLKQKLFPFAKIITPNVREASVLLSCSEGEILEDPKQACVALTELGPEAVVITGGDVQSEESIDYFFSGGESKKFSVKKVDSKNTHGSGCTFSSALAAGLAKNFSLLEAVQNAKNFTLDAIISADKQSIGKASGPVSI